MLLRGALSPQNLQSQAEERGQECNGNHSWGEEQIEKGKDEEHIKDNEDEEKEKAADVKVASHMGPGSVATPLRITMNTPREPVHSEAELDAEEDD